MEFKTLVERAVKIWTWCYPTCTTSIWSRRFSRRWISLSDI